MTSKDENLKFHIALALIGEDIFTQNQITQFEELVNGLLPKYLKLDFHHLNSFNKFTESKTVYDIAILKPSDLAKSLLNDTSLDSYLLKVNREAANQCLPTSYLSTDDLGSLLQLILRRASLKYNFQDLALCLVGKTCRLLLKSEAQILVNCFQDECILHTVSRTEKQDIHFFVYQSPFTDEAVPNNGFMAWVNWLNALQPNLINSETLDEVIPVAKQASVLVYS